MFTKLLSFSLAPVYALLTDFAQLDNFWDLFERALGRQYDSISAASLRSQWLAGDFREFPPIEVVSSQVLGNANGAYAISTNTIYLSDSFIASATAQEITAIVLEEFGHYVDAQVNQVDTPGDEGELFSDWVRGVELSEPELQRLKTEDDSVVFTIDGKVVQLEQSADLVFSQQSLQNAPVIIANNQENNLIRLPGSVLSPSVSLNSDALPGSGESSFIPPSSDLQNRLMTNAQTANVQVNYHNFTPQAQTAFDYAVKIWSSILVSTVPITVDAYWQPLASGALGQGGPNTLFRTTGTPPSGVQPNTWYPVALANQFAGQDLDPGNTDLTSTLNSNFNWYYGTDGKTPTSQIDLVSVALQELLHGLGSIGLMNYSNGQGEWGYGTGYPSIYDRYLENGSGQSLLSTNLFPNPSFTLGNQLTSNNLFFDGSNAIAGNNGNRPKLYAPSSWQQGSSLYHLDENTYPQGNPNSLNTPYINYGESIHDPGSIIRGLLKDEGWKISIETTPQPPPPYLPPPLDTSLFRFQNTSIPGTYLFAGEQEAASIRQNYKNFKEEGFAFGVATSQADPLLQPFYRFQNTSMPGTYLYAGEQEAASIRQNYKNFYEEGLAFYAYGADVGKGTTFNRFQNTSLPGTYLFAGPSETASILTNYQNFHLEGIAFEAAG
jgi:hypothetical protein